jgi:hypothetical protein
VSSKEQRVAEQELGISTMQQVIDVLGKDSGQYGEATIRELLCGVNYDLELHEKQLKKIASILEKNSAECSHNDLTELLCNINKNIDRQTTTVQRHLEKILEAIETDEKCDLTMIVKLLCQILKRLNDVITEKEACCTSIVDRLDIMMEKQEKCCCKIVNKLDEIKDAIEECCEE